MTHPVTIERAVLLIRHFAGRHDSVHIPDALMPGLAQSILAARLITEAQVARGAIDASGPLSERVAGETDKSAPIQHSGQNPQPEGRSAFLRGAAGFVPDPIEGEHMGRIGEAGE